MKASRNRLLLFSREEIPNVIVRISKPPIVYIIPLTTVIIVVKKYNTFVLEANSWSGFVLVKKVW